MEARHPSGDPEVEKRSGIHSCHPIVRDSRVDGDRTWGNGGGRCANIKVFKTRVLASVGISSSGKGVMSIKIDGFFACGSRVDKVSGTQLCFSS
jgi:hypothetical protein